MVPGKEHEAFEVSIQLGFFSTGHDLAQMGIVDVSVDPEQSSEHRPQELLTSCAHHTVSECWRASVCVCVCGVVPCGGPKVWSSKMRSHQWWNKREMYLQAANLVGLE